MPFRVKICGITNVADALAAAEAGADAIGLNFYPGSPRSIPLPEAQRVAAALSADIVRVGVFVNATSDEICRIGVAASLGLVQLHGDEPPEFLRELGGFEIIRARRLDDRGTKAIEADVDACYQAAGRAPSAVLIDAAVAGQFGGSGKTVDWQRLAGHKQWLKSCPLILAGGLTPANVAEAIQVVKPLAVDVASGVESSPGKKDRAKMRDFVAAARAAFS